jgi:heterodisulfide reductase subunit A2
MVNQGTTGVYFHTPLNGNNGSVDITQLIAYIRQCGIPNVIWNHSDLPINNIERTIKIIKESKITRLVITGYEPGMVKSFFSRALLLSGISPENIILAGFNEFQIRNTDDLERAKAILFTAINGADYEDVAIPVEREANHETLVIGGGIAGIQASLELANAGLKVHLVEKTGTIGGHMATFDKTFPTLDCAACILTPKMVEIGQHPNIDLLTYCEVLDVKGMPGNYQVTILKKARRVNLSTCIGCGTCSEKCPVRVPSEFDAGTTLRKAIYIPFPQAVPNKYLIDEAHCTYVESKKCGVCAKVCPVSYCINLEEKDTEIEINVGNIIVATGFKVFNASRMEQYGYGKFMNVVTSLEFERLVNASGPTGGHITGRSIDKKGNRIFLPENPAPKSIALIHCIGSRDENYNKYCSRVCCMYSLKLAHLIKEKLPDADVYEYYIDMRAFGKGYEEFYERIKHEGVHIIRGKSAKVEEKDGKLILSTEDIKNDRLLEQEIDMVVLAVGLEPDKDSEYLSKLLGISKSEDGWFQENNINSDPVGTYSGGIYIAGACQGPKDIPDSVVQASAAASRVIQSILKNKVQDGLKHIKLDDVKAKVIKIAQEN